MNKAQLDLYKSKKVTFKLVDESPDIRVQFVRCHAEYKVRLEDDDVGSIATIKVKIVNDFPDVRLQQVETESDFKACFS